MEKEKNLLDKYKEKLMNAKYKRERAVAGEHKFQFEYYNIECGILAEVVADLEKVQE